jgi:DNA-3-methyladenine glycosylase
MVHDDRVISARGLLARPAAGTASGARRDPFRRDDRPQAGPRIAIGRLRKTVKIERDFYLRDDVVQISRELLGKMLCTRIDGNTTKAVITETEAYAGVTDKASHAFGNRRTKRTEPMFGQGGIAYVYLCYGIHHLFNVVTNKAETPHAVLIRAGVPAQGTRTILERRDKPELDKSLLSGPGSLARGLGITTSYTGTPLTGTSIWIEDHGRAIGDGDVLVGPRVGIDYAEEDAARPYRFRFVGSL